DRHIQRNLDVLAHALEIEMHDLRTSRVSLDGLDDDLLRLRTDLQRQDAGGKGFTAHLVLERVVVESDGFGSFTAAMHDGAVLAGSAQAAAIGAADLGAGLSGQFECGFHGWYLQASRES